LATVALIYCGGGNPRFATIAHEAGFLYGAQLPGSLASLPLYFADQDWKRPRRTAYMRALDRHRPQIATVLDWEHDDQWREVLDWAEEAAQYAFSVMIIPKVVEGLERIPETIGGVPVVIGYSVPTKHGATCVPIWELAGRKVHLLGGSPHRQRREYHAISGVANVISVDGNMAMKMAVRHCQYWIERPQSTGYWVALRPASEDAPYEAFRRSCANIRKAWGVKELMR